MKHHSLLCAADMVRAILDGRPRQGSNSARKVRAPGHLIAEAYRAGHTIKEIADAIGCSVQPIKRILRESGVKRRPAKQRPGILAGARNPSWKGGRRRRPDGYIEIRRNGSAVLEHRAVMEVHLDRPLLSTEVVHHRNGDPADNRIDNLEVMSRQEHIDHHRNDLVRGRYG